MNAGPILTSTIQPYHASSSLKAGLFFLFAASAVVLIPFLPDTPIVVLVLAMLGCLTIPAWIAIQRNAFDAFESIHVIGLRYFAFFGLGALWTAQDPANIAYDRYIQPYLLEATLYCALGYLALLAGYYASWFRTDVVRRTEEQPTTVWFVLVPGLLGFVGAMAATLWAWAGWAGIDLSAGIGSLAQLSPLYDFAWALCWLLVLSPATRPWTRGLLLAAFVPATGVILLRGLTDKSMAFSMAVVPICAASYARGRLPWKTLVALVLVLVFVIFPFFDTFRWLDPRIDTVTRAEMTSGIISSWDADTYAKESTTAVMRRLALINSVAVVVRDTPRWVPYANGRTIFLPALALFVPRVLWPDKPLFDLGREFGQTFRVVLVFDDRTSIAATVPGELFWNFDLPGILIGMAIWGTVLRFLYRRYGQGKGLDPVRRATHIVLLIQFIHFGGGLAGQGVMVLRTLILIEAFRWFSRKTGLLRVDRVGAA